MQGLHLIADAQYCLCQPELLTRTDLLQALCLQATQSAKLSAVNHLFHKFSADVQSGITGVVLLAESHVAIHTWPELQAVTLDVYACNYGNDNSHKAKALMTSLLAQFQPTQVRLQEVERGQPTRPTATIAG